MFQSLTRAQFRDVVRRNLGIRPPVDDGIGFAGDEPSGQASPKNAEIDATLEEAIAYLNTEAGFRATEFSYPIAAVSATYVGPLAQYMGSNTQPPNLLTDVRRATWYNGTVTTVLTPTSQVEQDRLQTNYLQQGPSTPTQYWIQSYTVYLLPAPAAAGTLSLYGGTAIYGFTGDNGTIDQLPVEMQYAVSDCATWLLLRRRAAIPEYAQMLGQYVQSAAIWAQKLKDWAASLNREFTPSIGFVSYRNSQGTIRIRR